MSQNTWSLEHKYKVIQCFPEASSWFKCYSYEIVYYEVNFSFQMFCFSLLFRLLAWRPLYIKLDILIMIRQRIKLIQRISTHWIMNASSPISLLVVRIILNMRTYIRTHIEDLFDTDIFVKVSIDSEREY